MFCKKCGSRLPEGAAFCGVCGEKVVLDTPEVQNSQPAHQPTQPDQTVQSTPQSMPQSTPVENIKNVGADIGNKIMKAKKRFPKAFIIIPVAIVVLVAIVISFAFIPVLRRFWEDNIARPVSGTLVKTFGSDEDYFQFVEKEAFNGYGGYIGTATNVYGTLMDTTEDDTYVEATMSFNASEDALELLGENIADCDLSFINETVFKLAGGQNGDLFRINGELEVNGKAVLDPSVLIDMDKGEAFISLLCLNSKYIRTEIEGIDSVSEMLNDSLIQNESLRKAIPSDDELNALLRKYIKVALDELDGVTVGEDDLEIGDIEETLTTVELEFNEETAINMARALLEEAKKDRKLKSYINDVAKVLEEEDLFEDADEVYDGFIEQIEETLEFLEDVDADADEVIFILKDYVDSSHKVVGRSLHMGDDSESDPVAFYGTVHDGKDFAFELAVPYVGIEVIGEGTDKGGVLTGDYIASLHGKEMIKLSLEKFDTDAISDGKLKGKITIAPSKALIDQIGGNGIEYYGIAIADLALQLDLDVTEKKADIKVNVLVDEEVFAGVNLAYKIGNAPNFKTPSAKKVVNIDDMDEWMEEIDVDKFIENLEKAKLPEELVELIEDATGELENIGGLFEGFNGIGDFGGMGGFGDFEDAFPDYEAEIETNADEDYEDVYEYYEDYEDYYNN